MNTYSRGHCKPGFDRSLKANGDTSTAFHRRGPFVPCTFALTLRALTGNWWKLTSTLYQAIKVWTSALGKITNPKNLAFESFSLMVLSENFNCFGIRRSINITATPTTGHCARKHLESRGQQLIIRARHFGLPTISNRLSHQPLAGPPHDLLRVATTLT